MKVEVSFPVDVSTNEPADCVVIDTCPGVPPVVALENKMVLEVVQAAVVTVIAPGVPDIFPDTPTESLVAVVEWITSLFPAAPKTRLPLVAVTFPAVTVNPVPIVAVVVTARDDPAVMVVPDARVVVVVKEPGAVIAAGRDRVVVPADVEAVT